MGCWLVNIFHLCFRANLKAAGDIFFALIRRTGKISHAHKRREKRPDVASFLKEGVDIIILQQLYDTMQSNKSNLQ